MRIQCTFCVMAQKTLAEWMATKRWKDADLAREIHGLSRSQISRIRRGVSCPTIATARKLEGVTKIPAARFVMGEAADGSQDASA